MGQLQQQKVAEMQNRMALQGMQQKARQEEAARVNGKIPRSSP